MSMSRDVLNSFFSLSFLSFFFTFAIETSEGKYVSPFHDIPLIAETEQVTLGQLMFCGA